MFPNEDYMKTTLNGIGARFKKVENRAAQGDWQENDASKGSYVKNRPGGYDVIREEEISVDLTKGPGEYENQRINSTVTGGHYWVKISPYPITFEEFQNATYNTGVPDKVEEKDGIYVAGGNNIDFYDKYGAISIWSFVIVKPGNYGLLGNFSQTTDVGVYVEIHYTTTGGFIGRTITYTRHIAVPQPIPEKYLPSSTVLFDKKAASLETSEGEDITNDVVEVVGGRIVLDYVARDNITNNYFSNKTYDEIQDDLRKYSDLNVTCGVMFYENFYQFATNVSGAIYFTYESQAVFSLDTLGSHTSSVLILYISNAWELNQTSVIGLYNSPRKLSLTRKQIPVFDKTGKWDLEVMQTELPTVSSSDNGKILQVVNGEWTAVELTNANGVNF